MQDLRESTIGLAVATLAILIGAIAPAVARAQPADVLPGSAGSRPAVVSQEIAGSVHSQVAARMARHDPSVRARVARAILEEARLASMDPLLVLALIQIESSFDPHAVSPAGAIGLMQLREPTLRREAERSRLPSPDPRDPVTSVRLGVRYLRRLLDAFGRLDVALMAYNAGPNRILSYMRQGEIPERFHVYPRKVRRELDRLHTKAGQAVTASSAEPLQATGERRAGNAG
jgi:soluble lytic murein transglycosylase-like protein